MKKKSPFLIVVKDEIGNIVYDNELCCLNSLKVSAWYKEIKRSEIFVWFPPFDQSNFNRASIDSTDEERVLARRRLLQHRRFALGGRSRLRLIEREHGNLRGIFDGSHNQRMLWHESDKIVQNYYELVRSFVRAA